MEMSDPFAHLTEDEREFLHMVLTRKRIDERRGRIWQQIWPDVGGTFAMPIPLPMANGEKDYSDEVDGDSHRPPVRPTPPPSTRLPQLEHDEDKEADEDEPPPFDLKGLDDIILTVLDESPDPIKIITIAKRGKITYNSYLRERVSALHAAGKIFRTPDNRYASLSQR